jgi:hypothetical protein
VNPIQGGTCIDPHGFDAGKKVRGKKRHVLVDTQGLLMQAIVHAAGVQDRDGGVLLMGALFGLYPFLLKLYADGGYQGPQFQQGLRRVCRQVEVEMVCLQTTNSAWRVRAGWRCRGVAARRGLIA